MTDQIPRHCAFCLIEIIPENVKTCGKCLRRAYCSKECQTLDWKMPKDSDSPRGQGHKKWCGRQYGEEDLDWKIVPIEEKGLGVVALRPIPAKYRIMVDACQTRPTDHPGTQDLMPIDGTLEEKFKLNYLGCTSNKAVLCLRLARLNHSCNANASHVYLSNLKVKILFAERDIEVGDEICICYTTEWNSQSERYIIPELHHVILSKKWNIACPSDCFCRNVEVQAAIERARKLDASIGEHAGNPSKGLKAVSDLLKLQEKTHASFMDRKRTLYDGFQFGITTQRTHDVGMAYLKELHDLWSSITHPEDEEMIKYDQYLKDPTKHKAYMLHSLRF